MAAVRPTSLSICGSAGHLDSARKGRPPQARRRQERARAETVREAAAGAVVAEVDAAVLGAPAACGWAAAEEACVACSATPPPITAITWCSRRPPAIC